MLDLYLDEALIYFVFKCHDRLNDNDLVFEKKNPTYKNQMFKFFH